MRSYKILYYTKNQSKFSSFKKDYAQELTDAQYQGTPVIILDSFKGIIPVFKDTNSLAYYLSEYSGYLSDVIVIIDSEHLEKEAGGAKNLRKIIIEYPEIKFLFDADPKWILFNKEDILEDILNASLEECKSCLMILNDCMQHQVINPSFLTKLSNQNAENEHVDTSFVRRFYSGLKGICGLIQDDKDQTLNDKVWNLLRKVIDSNPLFIRDDIRDVRKAIIRRIAIDYVLFELITIPKTENNSNLILSIVEGYDNLFDASNLRYAIKQWKYAELDVHAQNFRKTQESRRDHLAICVEEEREQNRFNSYCMFTNGYRVLPVISAKELMRINMYYFTQFKPSIVLRDYDIQFPDQHKLSKNTGTEPIDQIRGFRFHEKSNTWTIHLKESKCWSSFYNNYSEQQECYAKVPIIYVSKGGRNLKITNFYSLFFSKRQKCDSQFVPFKIKKIFHKSVLLLPGLTKPISGIHCPFFDLKQIRFRFDNSRLHKRNYLNTSRQGHEHGTSLDIYSMVKSILGRAKMYYESGKYIHAAILANEAIEYLNGFHQALMIEAYYINAISENAIAINAMGVDEEKLSEDAWLRAKKIKEDITRIYAQKGLSKITVADLSKNTLNQIYSECRAFCRNKEHFKAESVFISAIGHLNENLFGF